MAPSRLHQRQRMPGAAPRCGQPQPRSLSGRATQAACRARFRQSAAPRRGERILLAEEGADLLVLDEVRRRALLLPKELQVPPELHHRESSAAIAPSGLFRRWPRVDEPVARALLAGSSSTANTRFIESDSLGGGVAQYTHLQ
eukprot:scaffold113962_cov69-Phaeocystis_antarctica.AAC.1